MRIIVAVDIIGGKCVRLTKGDFSTQKIYNENPLEIARKIEDYGINYIHLVDLDGAKHGHIVNRKILENIAMKTSVKVDFGGGIRSNDDMRIALNSGADQVTCGSITVTNPALFLEWLANYGSEKIILGADCINRKVTINAWVKRSETDIISFISDYQLKGLKYTICTDIEKDGMLQGPSAGLYKEILKSVSVDLIASGGISSIDDIEELREIGCEGAIIGKAVFEGKLTLKELSRLC